MGSSLPTEAEQRKSIPVYSGFFAYFPDAVCAVAELSRIGNDQHNPGKPLFWDRSKSGDELDALCRHLLDTAMGTPVDTDDVLHATKVAWRAMANLQKTLEELKEEDGPVEDSVKFDVRETVDASKLSHLIGEEPAEDTESPPELKVGDMVQVLGDSMDWEHRHSTGSIVRVEEVDWADSSIFTGNYWVGMKDVENLPPLREGEAYFRATNGDPEFVGQIIVVQSQPDEEGDYYIPEDRRYDDEGVFFGAYALADEGSLIDVS